MITIDLAYVICFLLGGVAGGISIYFPAFRKGQEELMQEIFDDAQEYFDNHREDEK